MKRLLLLAAICLIFQQAPAQWILGFTVLPVAPTTNDTITVIVDVSFPSGGCDDKIQNMSVAGNHIYAGALHCLGNLSFICNTTDTFKINPLPAGSYTFAFQVDAGQGPSPCTPGFVPGPTDSVSFTVTSASSIPENPNDFHFGMFPLPANNHLTLTFPVRPPKGAAFEIVDISGKVILRKEQLTDGMTIGLENLATGNYVARLVRPDKVLGEKKFTVLR